MTKKLFVLQTIFLLIISCSFSETETYTGTIIYLTEENTGTKITVESTVETDFYDQSVLLLGTLEAMKTFSDGLVQPQCYY